MGVLAWSGLWMTVAGMAMALIGVVVFLLPIKRSGGYTLTVVGSTLACVGAVLLSILMVIDLYSWTQILLTIVGALLATYITLKIDDHIRPRVIHKRKQTRR
jgi:hypothetical protein